MIATCYDSFIISRRVIPRNPAPQFIRRDVPLNSTSHRIVRDVASRTSPAKRLRVGADAAPSKYITAGATIFFEVIGRHRRRFPAFSGSFESSASLNPLVLTDELSRHSHALPGIFLCRFARQLPTRKKWL